MSFINKPIPFSTDISGWERVPINECGERLISINNLCSEKICCMNEYYRKNIYGAIKEIYLRESVANLLVKATTMLPRGYKIIVFDGWRPVEVQKNLFENYYNFFIEQYPYKNNNEIIELTKKYVSYPSISHLNPSPHNTGGAIDVSLMDRDGVFLDMGSKFDDFSKLSKTNYFEIKSSNEVLSSQELNYQYNRRYLFNLMVNAGFTNYNEEWWHYDYGNQFWAKSINVNAIYGPAKL